MIQPWLALPVGACIATLVMLVGFGGGMLWMPFLLIVMQLPPQTAIITSLLIQVAGTGSGSLAYLRQGKADVKLALVLLVVAIPGVELGAYAAHRLVLTHIELLVGLIALVTAFVFVSSNQKYTDEGTERVQIRQAYRYSWVTVFMAIVSGMLTVNLGEWLVPFLRKQAGLRISNGIATCIVLTCGISLLGALIHYHLGARPSWGVAFWGIPGVIIGGQIGARLVRHIDERMLKEIFIFVLTLIGIHLVYRSFPV
ncbi:MAG TPA: hypothetical protein DCZ69_09950 [Syntrophobacteraceae bacterium]|nr:hypothetical protein [Syntrophobacteraceae bacterium]